MLYYFSSILSTLSITGSIITDIIDEMFLTKVFLANMGSLMTVACYSNPCNENFKPRSLSNIEYSSALNPYRWICRC